MYNSNCNNCGNSVHRCFCGDYIPCKQPEPENPCGVKNSCKSKIPSDCIYITQDLLFLGLEQDTNLQLVLNAVNNALLSISQIPCITYTRTIDENCNVVFQHSMDWECVANNIICPPPVEPCVTCLGLEPTSLTVNYDGSNFGTSGYYMANISWIPVSGVLGYILEYKKASSSTWISLGQQSTTTAQIVVSLNNGLYQDYMFRVKTICSEGCESGYFTSTHRLNPCLPPTKLTYSDNLAYLTFESVVGLTTSNFIVQYLKEGDSIPVTASLPVTEYLPGKYRVQFLPLNLYFLPLTKYKFFVRQICGTTISDYARGCAYDCTVPIRSMMVNSVSPTEVVVTWTLVSGISNYILEVRDQNTNYIINTYNSITGTISVTGLQPSTPYRFTLRYVCDNVCGSCNSLFADLTTQP